MTQGAIDPTPPESLRSRLLPALLIGVLAALWSRQHALANPAFTSDFDQVWAAAAALLRGDNPYAEVGPNAPFTWRWPLYYPMPAILVAAPLGALPVIAARAIFSGLGAALFTFAISRDGWARWPILLSVTFLVSIDLVQWSPYLAAAFFLPAAALLVPCKPNFALPVAACARDARTWGFLLLGGVVLGVASFAARPTWVAEWLGNVREAPHFIPPVMRRGGPLLLLAVLRWRRPEARWFLGLCVMPMAPSFYDQLLLVAVCTRWWESAILALSTYVLYFYVGAHSPQPDYAAWGRLVGDATVWFCYLPMLAVLLRRPNEGRVPNPRSLIGRWSSTPERAT
ncbi:MAG TPA: hypothetical protein VFV33_25645 [Gemmatimonadaceae bacterium]|nr:hypothetical protein [Gemmatimonadaceae bacterium]